MKLEHVAVWTNQLEEMKAFYTGFFHAVPNDKYCNPAKSYSSYFLSFESGARLELMQRPDIPGNKNDVMDQSIGLIHIAISTGSKEQVDTLTEAIRAAGYPVIGEPRWTGDGYYESIILDPDGNRVEVTI